MNSLNIKRQLAFAYAPFAQGLKTRKQILIYHAIGDFGNAISHQAFKQQMDWLKDNVQIVDLATLLSDQSNESLVAITFDDGYVSVYQEALPLLEAINATATVYINTAWIDEEQHKLSNPEEGHYPDEKFMTWSEVRILQQKGWNIGSHGHHHFDLTRIENSQVQYELEESKRQLQKRLNLNDIDFSYTWGHHNPELQAMVRNVGYRSAVAGQHGALTSDSNYFAIPRIDVRREYTLNDFVSIMKGRWDFLGTIQKYRHG